MGRISFACIPETDQVSAGGKTAGDIPVSLHMERGRAVPDQLKRPGEVFHVFFQQLFAAVHLIGENEGVITEPDDAAVSMLR